MKFKMLVMGLIAITTYISADIFDVFESYKKYRDLPDDVQTLIAQQIIADKILTRPTVKTLRSHTSMITSVAWSPDGTQLASAAGDQTIKIWNTATGQNTHTLRGHTDWVNSVAWSPDGTQLASASWDRTIKIWDTATWQPIRTLQGHTSIISVAWSPDGTQLASALADGNLNIWDTTTWQNTQTLQGHTNFVNAVAWSPDGRQLASASQDSTIKIWDTTTWQNRHTLQGHTGLVDAGAWSPDGTQLASASQDSTIKIWSFPQPLLTNDEWQNLSLEQALLLTLLHTKRPTYALAQKKCLKLEALHPQLSGAEALAILHTLKPASQMNIQKRFSLVAQPMGEEDSDSETLIPEQVVGCTLL